MIPEFLSEQAILGGMLVDRELLEMAVDSLGPDHFSAAEHRRVFEVIADMHTRGIDVDPITVAVHLGRDGTPNVAAYMVELTQRYFGSVMPPSREATGS